MIPTCPNKILLHKLGVMTCLLAKCFMLTPFCYDLPIILFAIENLISMKSLNRLQYNFCFVVQDYFNKTFFNCLISSFESPQEWTFIQMKSVYQIIKVQQYMGNLWSSKSSRLTNFTYFRCNMTSLVFISCKKN